MTVDNIEPNGLSYKLKKFSSYPFSILFLALVKVHVAQKNVNLPRQVQQNVVKVQNAGLLQIVLEKVQAVLLHYTNQTHQPVNQAVR